MFLPPQEEVLQIKSLLAVIADPSTAKKLLDKMTEVDSGLDQKKQDIDSIANETRNKLDAESKKALALQDEAKAQLELADQRLQKAIALEVSVKAESQKNADLSTALKTLSDQLSTRAVELSNRELNVSKREANASLKETSLADQENSLAQRQQDLDARFARLREVAQ